MRRPRHRAQGTLARVALVTGLLLMVASVCGCGHHAARPRQAHRSITFGVNGRIGPLRVDVSDRRDVIAFLGRPDAERRARTDQEDFRANIPYDALGYGCSANPGPDAMSLVRAGPRCRTVFFIDRRGRLGLFVTTQARYVEKHGVRIGMPTAKAERLLRQRLHVGCVADIFLSSPHATMSVSFDGGTLRHDGTLRGGHVSLFVLHGEHHDIGLFECE
jgi:hypothetical protein